ncbi:uncharacterized protein F4807DRAFT_305027 [Annulohypoxylon truncatum]|uniref:uncharacterized protein n=1 Tax=Annulohypoxylon truncatum TaxID=327061 RepID=UPI002007F4BB|nr:uncharacterized protein F4807DRAFT_305027 [Annulohypoxylon truncatum]KAI1212927.1 hypothetical protein F4807DRAFT_305027 [Annulohypoxylon truncatum]
MSRQLALSAFRVGNGVLGYTTRRIAASTRRTFSSTAQRKKEMIYFSKASSQELDDVLTEIRRKIVLPAYLPQPQRAKIYAKKYEKKLQSDPVTIEVDREVFKFRYVDPYSGVPSTKRILFRALDLFSEPADFDNLRPLIEGLAAANRKLSVETLAKLVRVVGTKGHIYKIVELARSVKRTGFKLDESETVNEVLHFIQMKAVFSDWDPAATEKALRWAEIVVDLLEEEDHQPTLKKKDGPPPPGWLPLPRDPMVLLSPLHLAAALALKQGAEAEADVVDKVVKYATKIVLLWEEDKALRQTQPAALFKRGGPFLYISESRNNKFVKLAAPWLYGLNAAVKVLQDQGPQHSELAAQLQKRRDNLDAEIQEARKTASGEIGEVTWRQVFEGENVRQGEQEDGVKVEDKTVEDGNS